MKSIQINGTARKEFGKKFAKAARREGQVPCIVYGGGEEVTFTIDAKELAQLHSQLIHHRAQHRW